MERYFLRLIFLVVIVQGTFSQECQVLTECEDSVQWKTWPTSSDMGRPGKRGALGPKGQKGEQGLGVNMEEFKAQLKEDNDGPILHFYTKTITWESGKSFCHVLGKRLCSSQELCVDKNGGKQLVVDVIPGDNWVPIIDKNNEWLEAGDYLKRSCLLHQRDFGSAPSWGISAAAHAHKGFVFCCPRSHEVDQVDPGMKYQYIGKAATYETSKQHCSEQGRRLCYSSEVCQKNVPVFGVINGDMWVAVQDRTNEWIEIGDSSGRTCWIHGVRHGTATWGTRTDGSLVEHVGYVLCCQNSD
ncbi:uncharacterized protein LOC120339527 [Styela clava]